jgi:hypothetical protein
MSPPPPPPTASAYTPPPPPPTGTTPNRSPAAPLDVDLLDRMKTDQALYASIQAQQRLLLLQVNGGGMVMRSLPTYRRPSPLSRVLPPCKVPIYTPSYP